MERIQNAFATGQENNQPLFIAYLCAGDPDFSTCLESCRAALASGVDILELGVPFSDPLADGLTNQLAAERALAAGMTQDKVFQLVREIRTFSQVPIVLYTYYNLIFSIGEERYAARAKEAGVDGLLTLDLPPEEAEGLVAACQKEELANIFIVSPTTDLERMKKINAVASGFIYYVSREGVTGERTELAQNLGDAVQTIKSVTDLPVAVGFGISTSAQVQEVGKIADGVVVGSAIVNVIPANLKALQEIPTLIGKKIQSLLTSE